MDTETKKFWAMLDQTFTSVSACWDRKNGTMNTVKLERLLGVASSGERHGRSRADRHHSQLADFPASAVTGRAAEDGRQGFACEGVDQNCRNFGVIPFGTISCVSHTGG
jgi:hypothetical protein